MDTTMLGTTTVNGGINIWYLIIPAVVASFFTLVVNFLTTKWRMKYECRSFAQKELWMRKWAAFEKLTSFKQRFHHLHVRIVGEYNRGNWSNFKLKTELGNLHEEFHKFNTENSIYLPQEILRLAVELSNESVMFLFLDENSNITDDKPNDAPAVLRRIALKINELQRAIYDERDKLKI